MGRHGIAVLVLLLLAGCAASTGVTSTNVSGRARPVAAEVPSAGPSVSATPSVVTPPGGASATVTDSPDPSDGAPTTDQGPAGPAEPAPQPGPYEQIVSALHGLCLDLYTAGKGDGIALIQWPCDEPGPQRLWGWAGGYGENVYKIVSKHSGKCLEVSGGAKAVGTPIVQMTCRDSGGAQLWQRVGDGASNGWNYWRITNVRSGLCIDVPSESTDWGEPLWVYTCHPGQAQQFRTPM